MNATTLAQHAIVSTSSLLKSSNLGPSILGKIEATVKSEILSSAFLTMMLGAAKAESEYFSRGDLKDIKLVLSNFRTSEALGSFLSGEEIPEGCGLTTPCAPINGLFFDAWDVGIKSHWNKWELSFNDMVTQAQNAILLIFYDILANNNSVEYSLIYPYIILNAVLAMRWHIAQDPLKRFVGVKASTQTDIPAIALGANYIEMLTNPESYSDVKFSSLIEMANEDTKNSISIGNGDGITDETIISDPMGIVNSFFQILFFEYNGLGPIEKLKSKKKEMLLKAAITFTVAAHRFGAVRDEFMDMMNEKPKEVFKKLASKHISLPYIRTDDGLEKIDY